MAAPTDRIETPEPSAATEAVGTAAFRERLRATWSPRYSGPLHAAFTACFGAAVFAGALARVHSPTAGQLAIVPLTFLYANFVEWLAHKGPMHHRTRGLALVHRRHTLEHHRFFTLRAMAFDSSRDVKMVLFPPLLILFFFGLFAAPLGLLLARFFSANTACLFVATAMGYFLSYELLHFSYHLPPDTWMGRARLVRALRRHHALHHDPTRMTEGNFNITFPICDALFGTRLVARHGETP